MSALIDSGRIVDIILVLMIGEAVLLFALRRMLGLGPGLNRLFFNLLAGACLLMALRCALTDGSSTTIAVWLAAGLAAHLLDVAKRWTS